MAGDHSLCMWPVVCPCQIAAFIHECFKWRAEAVIRIPPYVPAPYMLDTFSSSVSEWMIDGDVETHS